MGLFGLITLFYDMSTPLGLFNTNPPLKKNSSGII